MIKRMVIEIERDPALYPEGNIVEVCISFKSTHISAHVRLTSSGPEHLVNTTRASTDSQSEGQETCSPNYALSCF